MNISVAASETLGTGSPSVLSDIPESKDNNNIPGAIYTPVNVDSFSQTIIQVEDMDEAQRASIGHQASCEDRRKYGMEHSIRACIAIDKVIIKGTKTLGAISQ